MNIVDIQLSNADSSVNVIHNNEIVAVVPADGCSHRVTLSTVDKNTLILEHHSAHTVEIVSIAMFDMGHDRLKYLGMFNDANGSVYQSHLIAPGGKWVLEYQYPVFTWLHKVLHLGWLISPDVERQ
jgi:hypothetical protein